MSGEPESGKPDRVKVMAAIAASVSALAAAWTLYLKLGPDAPYTPPKQACQIPDAMAVAQFGLQPGKVDSMFPNACTWYALDSGAAATDGTALLSLNIRSDLHIDGHYSTQLSFGRVEEAPQHGLCTLIWPMGHGLLAYVDSVPARLSDNAILPCAPAEEWATALAPNMPADTAQ